MGLIDADELKQVIHSSNLSGNREWLLMELDKIIDNAPTVDLKDIYQEGHYDGHLEGYTKAINEERPQGEWIHYLGCGIGKAVCSECGQVGETKKYCGNCGADMRGKENDSKRT